MLQEGTAQFTQPRGVTASPPAESSSCLMILAAGVRTPVIFIGRISVFSLKMGRLALSEPMEAMASVTDAVGSLKRNGASVIRFHLLCICSRWFWFPRPLPLRVGCGRWLPKAPALSIHRRRCFPLTGRGGSR